MVGGVGEIVLCWIRWDHSGALKQQKMTLQVSELVIYLDGSSEKSPKHGLFARCRQVGEWQSL